jgi:hypothetical protein
LLVQLQKITCAVHATDKRSLSSKLADWKIDISTFYSSTFSRALLPSSVVYRILDAFFLEGHRVLMRYGLALIKLYKADIKSGKYITGDDFWICAQRFKDTRRSPLGITDVAFERRRALTPRGA